MVLMLRWMTTNRPFVWLHVSSLLTEYLQWIPHKLMSLWTQPNISLIAFFRDIMVSFGNVLLILSNFWILLGTIFAYGQTGTGKTYTSSGILSHSFEYIFDYISKSGNDTKFLVRASFYEIYNEEIRDLLVIIK